MTIRIATDMHDHPCEDVDARPSWAFRRLGRVARPQVHGPRGGGTVLTS